MGKQAKKATDVEIVLRLQGVRKLLLEGADKRDICRYAAETWNVSERQTERYIADAREMIEKDMSASGLAEMDWHIACRLHVYNLALKKEDYPTALRCVDSLAKLQGFLTDKMVHQGNDDKPVVVKLIDYATLPEWKPHGAKSAG